MASFFDRIRGMIPDRKPARPFAEQGVAGFAVWGGFIQTPETNSELIGWARWQKASDLICNLSIIAASLRYSLNMMAEPAWKAVPADESDAAKEGADFVEEVLAGIDTSWARIVRRTAMYRYHGFSINEWIALKREDGQIGIRSIESRPQHTIARWDIEDSGSVRGVWQTDPQTGEERYLPRQKLVYLVDDMLTDRPDGLGWFRQLVDPANRLSNYLRIESNGFERDLSGIPVGRAPLSEIQKLVDGGKITKDQGAAMVASMKDFIQLKAKQPNTGLLFDSQPYVAKTDTGESVATTPKWGMELLTGEQSSIEALGEAINRLATDMALIMGTEGLLVGRDGQGSRALSEDKSRNLYLQCNSALGDMAESFDRDIITPLWIMNGRPMETKPTLKPGDVTVKDVAKMTQALADMATAGAMLAPDDPAIDDIRDLMGISRQPEMTPERAGLIADINTALNPAPPAPANDDQNENTDAKKPLREAKTAKVYRIEKAAPRTLYVQRRLLNALELIEWAKGQGFDTTTPAHEIHVTIAHSSAALDWMLVPPAAGRLIVDEGGPRLVEPLGDKGAVVLLFNSTALRARFEEMKAAGASWDYPEYQPHVTISYAKPLGLDLATIEPYRGALEFGPELFSELEDGLADRIKEQ